MDGIAGVTMVKSSDESNTDRQRGTMISAIAVPDCVDASLSCRVSVSENVPLSSLSC